MRKKKKNPLDPNWHDHIVDLYCEEIHNTARDNNLPLPKFDDCIIDQKSILGCGEYGCAFECGDNCVVKLTLDSTEAHFIATMLQKKCQHKGIIHFKAIYALPSEYNGMPVFIMWREKAQSIGIPNKTGYRKFWTALDNLWQVSDALFEIAYKELSRSNSQSDYWEWLEDELKKVDILVSGENLDRGEQFANLLYGSFKLTKKVEESEESGRYVGKALGDLICDGLMLCDVHQNNVGVVKRNGEEFYCVTDVGHSLILDKSLRDVKIPIIGQ